MKSLLSLFRPRKAGENHLQQGRRAEVSAFEEPNLMLGPKNGTISIRGHKIVVTDPETGGIYASLCIPDHPNVNVLRNGTTVVGQVILTQDDEVRIECVDERTMVDIDICPSTDQMGVIAKVMIRRGVSYRVEDCISTLKAILQISEHPEVYVLPEHQVIQKVRDAGYVGIFDDEAIHTLCTQGGEAIVLRGKPATPSRPATFRPLPLPREHDVLHRKMRLSSVHIGTPVAVLDAAIPGQRGWDVHGNEIEPATMREISHELGKGVILINGLVVATIEGRLEWTSRWLSIVPELRIPNDITPREGHIEFNGDLVVYGSILDGSSVRVTGRVTVHGRICGATVIAGGSIHVTGNIVNSTVFAGQYRELYKDLHLILKEIATGLERFRAEYNAVLERVSVRQDIRLSVPMVANRLFEARHQALAAYLNDLCTLLQPSVEAMDARYKQLRDYVMAKWMGVHRTNIGPHDIDSLQSLVAEYVMHIETNTSDEPATIRGMNITSSSLRASGKVFINGSTYSSTIESGDAILVRGAVRGGFLVSQNSAWIRELGTPVGVECSVSVTSRRGKIVVTERHPNTLLDVGGHRDRNLLSEQKVHFKGGIA